MIRAALGLELRNILRSPLRAIVLVLVLGAGGFVIAQGQKDVARWQQVTAAGHAAEEAALAEVRGYLAAGKKGPAARPWVDLAQPRWQDYYAQTRLARAPAPLAGIAFASAEAGAVTIRLSRSVDPLLAAGNTIENPALAITGGLDLVTVLALLIPLLILALGLEIGGYERATGVLPLVRVQSGRDRAWIWARCVAVGLIAASIGMVLVLLAVLAAGAGAADGVPLAVLVLAYVATWVALLGAVATVARNPSHGAVVLGASWIVLCVLVPAVSVERSAALAADDFALDLTVEARDAGSAVAKLKEDELYAGVLARFPALEELVPQRRQTGVRVAREGMRTIGLEQRMALRAEREQAHTDLVARTSFLSPAIAFTHALEQLAGRGPDAARAYREAVAAVAAQRMEQYLAGSWRNQRLTADDFEQLVSMSSGSVSPPPATWQREFLILLAWTVILSGGAVWLSRQAKTA